MQLAAGKAVLPIPPVGVIDYNETDRLQTTLSTCKKIAYLDTTENIFSLLPFVNDNNGNVQYLTGVEPLFTVYRGWMLFTTRRNYAEKRIKIMQSSGIYAHWHDWFHLNKPPNVIFNHYANWTHPRFDVIPQLTYNSKVLTGFYISGICLVGCLICLMYELLYVWVEQTLNLVHEIP